MAKKMDYLSLKNIPGSSEIMELRPIQAPYGSTKTRGIHLIKSPKKSLKKDLPNSEELRGRVRNS